MIDNEKLQEIRNLLADAKNPNATAGELENKLIDDVGIPVEYVDDLAAFLRQEKVAGIEIQESDAGQYLIGVSSTGIQVSSYEIDPGMIESMARNAASKINGQAELDAAEADAAEADAAVDAPAPDVAAGIGGEVEAEPDNAPAQSEELGVAPEPEVQPAVEDMNEERPAAEASEEDASEELDNDNVAPSPAPSQEGSADEETEEEKRNKQQNFGISLGLLLDKNANNEAVLREIEKSGIRFQSGGDTFAALPDGVTRILTTNNGKTEVSLGPQNAIRVTRGVDCENQLYLIDRSPSHSYEAVEQGIKSKVTPFNHARFNERFNRMNPQPTAAPVESGKGNDNKNTPAPGGGGGGGKSLFSNMFNNNATKAGPGMGNGQSPSINSPAFGNLSAIALGGPELSKRLNGELSVLDNSLKQYRKEKMIVDMYRKQGIEPGDSTVVSVGGAVTDDDRAALSRRAMEAMEAHQKTIMSSVQEVTGVFDKMAESGMTIENLPNADALTEKIGNVMESMKESGEMLLGGVKLSEKVELIQEHLKNFLSALLGRGEGPANG